LCNETVVNQSIEDTKSVSIHVPNHVKPLNDIQFGHYFAGIIDGNGFFNNKQQLIIMFDLVDISLAYYIKKKLGFGSVKKVRNKKVFLVITHMKGIEKTINLINGKIRTKFIFNQILNILNNDKFKQKIKFKLNSNRSLKNY
jgi:hypothetical protein